MVKEKGNTLTPDQNIGSIIVLYTFRNTGRHAPAVFLRELYSRAKITIPTSLIQWKKFRKACTIVVARGALFARSVAVTGRNTGAVWKSAFAFGAE